jgi:hypothetical protein
MLARRGRMQLHLRAAAGLLISLGLSTETDMDIPTHVLFTASAAGGSMFAVTTLSS